MQSVATGFFRATGAVKLSPEESLVQWKVEAEKVLTDSLLQFYLYLFADLDDQV